uniref:SFRICE_038768 n=1 Tax=Spodoptera frugiperda TaxID=7108 RepID=A0A2H1WP85_SPOFR
MLRHERAVSTGVIPRPHRKPTLPEAQLPTSPIFPFPDFPKIVKFQTPKRSETQLVFRVSMGGGDCLPSEPICFVTVHNHIMASPLLAQELLNPLTNGVPVRLEICGVMSLSTPSLITMTWQAPALHVISLFEF